MAEQITNFLVKYNKDQREKQLLIWKSGSATDLTEVDLTKNFSYIIGYQYEGLDGIDGEYVLIKRVGNSIEIRNDLYASYQVYIYEDSRQVIVSSSIREIIRHTDAEVSVNGALLYDYYAFGYLPAVDDTIYKNIRSARPNSIITVNDTFLVKSGPLELLRLPEGEVGKSALAEYLCESIRRRINNIPLDKAIFCLTAGHDTLLGILGMRVNGYYTDTATWGLSHSDDIVQARLRHRLFSNNTEHIEMPIDDVKFTADDFESNSALLGGIGTAASIYLNYFTEKIVGSGKIHHLYCDAYEAARRIFDSMDYIREKYTTPRQVVEKYFLDLEYYDRRVDHVLGLIPAHYKNDYLLEFYYYDRCIKGPFYKNAVVRHLGGIKYTLSLDYRFINANHAIIRKLRELTYDDLLRALAARAGLDASNIISLLPAGDKQMPADTPRILKNNKDYFTSILDSPYSRELSELWDIVKMKDAISKDALVENEEWFILRLLNLLIFKDKFKIGLS